MSKIKMNKIESALKSLALDERTRITSYNVCYTKLLRLNVPLAINWVKKMTIRSSAGSIQKAVCIYPDLVDTSKSLLYIGKQEVPHVKSKTSDLQSRV